jgi:hypothetical protein
MFDFWHSLINILQGLNFGIFSVRIIMIVKPWFVQVATLIGLCLIIRGCGFSFLAGIVWLKSIKASPGTRGYSVDSTGDILDLESSKSIS